MLDASTLDRLLCQRADLEMVEGIIGATTAIEDEFLLEDEHNDDFDNGSEERSEGDEGEATSDIYETTTPALEQTSLSWIKYSLLGSKQSTKGRTMQNT